MPRITQENVNDVIETHVKDLELVQLVELLHVCSKQRRVVISRKSTSLISQQIQHLQAAKLNGPQIGKIMYSMKQFSSSENCVRQLLLALTDKIDKNEEILSSHTVANMLHGLCGMDSKYWEVRHYLKVLTKKLLKNTQPFKYFEVSSAMFGLRRMSSDHQEVQDVVSVLARKIEASREMFNSQVVSNCLYGMQNMSSQHEAVRYLLSVIGHKIEVTGLQGGECMNAQGVGNALYGLRGMSSNRLEVRRLLKALAPKVAGCEQPLTAQAVGNALFGFKRMNSDHEEVRQMLVALTPKIDSCFHTLSVQNIDNAFFGMQSLSSDWPEVRALLSALRDKLGTRQLDSHALGSVFFGLQRMECKHEEVRRLLIALEAALPVPRSDGTGQLQAVSFAMAFSGLRLMHDGTAEVDQLLQKVHALIVTCDEDFSISSLVNIVFGMQSMEARSDSAKGMLTFVSSRLASLGRVRTSSPASSDHERKLLTLNAPLLGRALYGLKSMTSDDKEVREMISALTEILESEGEYGLEGRFTALDLSRLVAGLRGMSSEHVEVNRLVSAVSRHIEDPTRCEALATAEIDKVLHEVQHHLPFINEEDVAALQRAILSIERLSPVEDVKEVSPIV